MTQQLVGESMSTHHITSMLITQSPQAAVPVLIVLGLATIFLGLGIRVFLSDARAYESARRLTGSPKRAVLGMVAPEEPCELDLDVERGFALGHVNGEVVIVPNGKLPADALG